MINPATAESGFVGRIPVRNLWLLMLYASDLFRLKGRATIATESNQDDIADLVAEILAHAVERRLKRNLSFGYQSREAVMTRVRGRIDLLTSERRQLLARGKVACRFEDLTIDTPRNRLVWAALAAVARIVQRSELAHRCRALAATLSRLGVSEGKPSRTELSTERFGRHDIEDRFMVAAAQLAFDLALPTEDVGEKPLLRPDREITWVRHLFEKAVGGFYDVTLSSHGWRVQAGKCLNWLITEKTQGIDRILPSMQTDIVLDHPSTGRRIVIDTKFTSIVTGGWFREETLRSGYVYQIYTYLRSQDGNGDVFADHASGLLLHPSIDGDIDERVTIQGHAIRFATVNLAASPGEIRARLLQLAEFS